MFDPASAQDIPVFKDVTVEQFARDILPKGRPAVLKNLVADWPVVDAAKKSSGDLINYLNQRDRHEPVPIMKGPAAMKGRFFYNNDLTDYNFQKLNARLAEALSLMENDAEDTIYIQSIPAPDLLTGFEQDNRMPLLHPSVTPRLWIGNQLTVQTHFDMQDNIACVVAGRRRFTLFPPDQTKNLYLGPFEKTLAGPPISMVRFHDVDLERYPRFEDAMKSAQVATLDPGDALFIPYLWWHHVESLEPFNMLVNYWWTDMRPDLGSPYDALLHAIATFRMMPDRERAAWREMFDHLVFETAGPPGDHLPEPARGVLGEHSADQRRSMKQNVIRALAAETGILSGQR